MGSIVEYKKPKLILPPGSAENVSQRYAKAASIVAEIDANAPTVETTYAENVAILKFLDFAGRDLVYQVGKMSEDKSVPNKVFEANRQSAILISQYLQGLCDELKRLNAEADAAPDTTGAA